MMRTIKVCVFCSFVLLQFYCKCQSDEGNFTTRNFGPDTWYVFEDNLPDILEIAKEQAKFVLLFYRDKTFQTLEKKKYNPDLSSLLDRVIPVFIDTQYDQLLCYTELLDLPHSWPQYLILLDWNGEILNAETRILNSEDYIKWFDETEFRFYLEPMLERYPTNQYLRDTYFKFVSSIYYSFFDLKIKKIKWFLDLYPNPKSRINHKAYELLIELYDCNAPWRSKEQIPEYYRSIEQSYTHIFNLYLPDKFQYQRHLRGYGAYKTLMHFYLYTESPNKALEVFYDACQNDKLLRTRISDYSLFDLYGFAIEILIDQGKINEANRLFEEADKLTADRWRPLEHYANVQLNIRKLIIEYWIDKDPQKAEDLSDELYTKTKELMVTYRFDQNFQATFAKTLLEIAVDHRLLIEEALDESKQIPSSNETDTHLVSSIILAKAVLLAKERSKEEARDFVIEALSGEIPQFTDPWRLNEDYHDIIKLLIEWHVVDDTVVKLTEMIANQINLHQTNLLMIKIYAENKEYEKAITFIDSCLSTLRQSDSILYECGKQEEKELVDIRSKYEKFMNH